MTKSILRNIIYEHTNLKDKSNNVTLKHDDKVNSKEHYMHANCFMFDIQ